MRRKGWLLLAAAWIAAPALAQVDVTGAWARATVPGQMGTGAFMTLTSKDGARVIGVATPVAGVAEIHEMKLEGGVMRMRAIDALDLPAGKPVELKPGGYHVMLLDLNRALKPGERIPLSLRVETRDRRLVTVPIEVEVGTRPPSPAGNQKH
ncbi:MAG: copper chaperone PCu(A)C [Gemmatimonadota bacterium]